MRVDLEKNDAYKLKGICTIKIKENKYDWTINVPRGSILGLLYNTVFDDVLIYQRSLIAKLYNKFTVAIIKIIRKENINIVELLLNRNNHKFLMTDVLTLFEGMDPDSEEFELYFLLQINNIIWGELWKQLIFM